MITRHAVGYSDYTRNYYVVKEDNPAEIFSGFDKDHNPEYTAGGGRPHEYEDQARLQAQMLNDLSATLSAAGQN